MNFSNLNLGSGGLFAGDFDDAMNGLITGSSEGFLIGRDLGKRWIRSSGFDFLGLSQLAGIFAFPIVGAIVKGIGGFLFGTDFIEDKLSNYTYEFDGSLARTARNSGVYTTSNSAQNTSFSSASSFTALPTINSEVERLKSSVASFSSSSIGIIESQNMLNISPFNVLAAAVI